MALIAVDLLSNRATFAVLGKAGKVLKRNIHDIKGISGSDVSKLIEKNIIQLFQSFEHKHFQLKSVGISVPGIYYTKTGTVWAPNIQGWENYPLRSDMNKLMEQGINIKIASKRTCDILGEKWLGAAKNSRNAVYLSIGSGIGAGILIDGKILHGFNDGIGAVGWMTMDRDFKEEYKARGFLEYKVSGNGILSSVKNELLSNPRYTGFLRKKKIEELNINDVFVAHELKDHLAEKILNGCIEYWGMAAANLISTFNPEIIIFGGSLFGPAIKFLPLIKAEAEKWAQPIFMQAVKFVKSELGADSGLFGAGHLALRKF